MYYMAILRYVPQFTEAVSYQGNITIWFLRDQLIAEAKEHPSYYSTNDICFLEPHLVLTLSTVSLSLLA